MSIPEEYQKPGYGTIYGDSEAKQAIALSEVALSVIGGGGGGSGGGATPAEIKSAIEAAANLESIEAKATEIAGNFLSTSNAITGNLAAINNNLLDIKNKYNQDIILTSSVLSPTVAVTSASGIIAAGCKSIAIANIGNAAGTVLSTSIAPGISIDWKAPMFDTLSSVAYNATGTSFLISTLKEGLPPVPDPYFNSVSLLMHFDGANNSSTFTDEKGHVPNINGTPVISTNYSKFGGSSLYLNASSNLFFNNQSDLDLSTGDFTIECWLYILSNPDNFGIYVKSGASNTGVLVNTKKLSFWIDANSPAPYLKGSTDLEMGQWYHLAVCRDADTFKCFVNGILDGSTTFPQATSLGLNSAVLGGGFYQNSLNGYIDEFRLTKGFTRYTTNFTIPDSAFPNN